MPPRLSIVIPVYNEAGLMEQVLQRVLASPVEGKEVLVVNDGSKDGTGEVLAKLQQRLPIRVITHPTNRGKGAAVRSGFQAATGDIVIIQDADLEYDPGDYPTLMRPILEGRAEVVLGSRFALHKPHFFTPQGEPFFTHYIGNLIVIWLTNTLYGFHATDYEGGYKAFTRQVIQETPVKANGFEFDNELICKLLRRRRKIVEVPIHYSPRSYKEGKKIRWQDGARMVWTIIKWRVMPL
ncbi:MAG: glycosyltransferase family 2 protein [Candidatus Omnitrophota bacterium]|nr:glycosyltransferase family 2 protein [Candidatus Omnitrophota bacterium]